METKIHFKKSNTNDVSLSVTGSSSISFEKNPTETFTYSITGVSADPTSANWRTHYAPRGYLWVPNVGFKCNEKLKHCDHMFYNRSTDSGTLTSNADISNLDMSEVVTACAMFRACSFASNSSDITGWDVSKVRDFQEMFRETDFNQDIGSWTITTDASTPINEAAGAGWTHPDVLIDGDSNNYFEVFSRSLDSYVSGAADHDGTGVNLGGMFEEAPEFNQDISGWDVSEVHVMTNMFYDAKLFNQDISGWDTSKVKNMYGLFGGSLYYHTFNQDISGWDVSSVRTFSYMFYYNTSFSQSINSWDTSSGVLMRGMFRGTAFNLPLNSWDTSSVIAMDEMFEDADYFNQNIGAWDVSSVTDMNEMFQDAVAFNNGGSGDMNNWDVTSVTDMGEMFENTAFDQDISGWDVSYFTSEPYQFSNGTPVTWTTAEKPQW